MLFMWEQEKYFYGRENNWLMIVSYCGYIKYSTQAPTEERFDVVSWFWVCGQDNVVSWFWVCGQDS